MEIIKKNTPDFWATYKLADEYIFFDSDYTCFLSYGNFVLWSKFDRLSLNL